MILSSFHTITHYVRRFYIQCLFFLQDPCETQKHSAGEWFSCQRQPARKLGLTA